MRWSSSKAKARPAAGDGDAQDRSGRLQRSRADLHGEALDRRAHLRFEAEDLVPDRDLIAGLEHALGHPFAVDPGAVAAAAVAKHITATLESELGVYTGSRRSGEDHVVL